MTKILHIGGVDSPHVMGIIEQINKYTNYEQAIISYPCNPIDKPLLNLANVTIYVYDYKMFFRQPRQWYNLKPLIKFLGLILKRERPDIITGHYLSQCAVPMDQALKMTKAGGVVIPWSTWDIQSNPILYANNKRCIDRCGYVAVVHPGFLRACLAAYHAPDRKGLCSGPVVRLNWYKDDIPDTSSPRIYVPRNYYQPAIFEALVSVVKAYPNVQITALSPRAVQTAVVCAGIADHVTFLPGLLSQKDFSDMIKRHNIIMSMAPDSGVSGTTLQATYFGAATISHKSHWANEFFTDEVNLLTCDLSAASIRDRVCYAIDHLPELCVRFKKNNAFLEQYDGEITGQNLMKAYAALLL